MARILYVMCGVGFSGKTTLARGLANSRSLHYVSLDRINEERGLNPGGEGLPGQAWARTVEMAKERIAGLMATGQPILVDDTACYRFLRDDYRSLASSHGYRTRIIFVDTPWAEVRRRIEANKSTRERDGFNEEVLAEHLAAFEPPQGDEDAIVFPGGDIHEWVKRRLPDEE